jgi:WXG100 family type VII secretion target
MSTYGYDTQSMQYVLGEMTSITTKIQTTLESLDNGAKQNLAEWTGTAQSAYFDAKAKWDTAAQQMHQQAEAARRALGNIDENYGAGERAGVNLWTSGA